MSSSYSSKLRDARWQRKRLEIMERDKWTCRSCGASGEGVTLNVHHAYYESGKDPWEYSSETLVTWCEQCHKARHDIQNLLLAELARKPFNALRGAFLLSVNYEKCLSYVGDNHPVLPYDDELCSVINVASVVFYAGMQSVEDSEGATLAHAKELMSQNGGDE